MHSSPAVANGVVYIGSWDDNVYALNAGTGVKLWSYRAGNVISSPPAVADGVVHVGSNDTYLYALNADTGALLWRHFVGGSQGMQAMLAVANGLVYAGSGYIVYALNARTGVQQWTFGAGSFVDSPAVANGVVYVGSWDYNVYALNAKTGTLLWSYPTGLYVYAFPAVANGVVYVGSDDGNLYAFGLTRGDERHRVAKPESDSMPPVLKMLRPDFNLKASKLAVTPSSAEREVQE